MASPHTPGPWKVEERGTRPALDQEGLASRFTDHLHLRVVSVEQDIDVADLNCDADDDEAVGTTRADALLIAQAPELLAHLREAHAELKRLMRANAIVNGHLVKAMARTIDAAEGC